MSVSVGTGSLLSDSGCFDGNGEAFAPEILQLLVESIGEVVRWASRSPLRACF